MEPNERARKNIDSRLASDRSSRLRSIFDRSIMPKNYADMTAKVVELLDKNPGQAVKELAQQLRTNRTFLAGYLKAMEAQASVRSKKIGPARVYFVNNLGVGSP